MVTSCYIQRALRQEDNFLLHIRSKWKGDLPSPVCLRRGTQPTEDNKFLLNPQSFSLFFCMSLPASRRGCLKGKHTFEFWNCSIVPILVVANTIKLTSETFIPKGGTVFEILLKIWSGYVHTGRIIDN